MVRSSISLCCVAIMCWFAVGAVDAGQRLDGSSVCDEAGLIGSAYGACNAYCEALDCDGVQPRGSETACENSLARFMDLTGETPPCEPVCPCAGGWLQPDFISEYPASLTCFRSIDDVKEYLELYSFGVDDDSGAPTFSTATLGIFDDETDGSHFVTCTSERYVGNLEDENSGNFGMQSTFRPESIRFDRQQNALFESCLAVFEKIIEENALDCEDPGQGGP